MRPKALHLSWQAPAAVFSSCFLISLFALRGTGDSPLPLALAADLLLTAPLLAFGCARPGARARVALRVLLLGATLAGLLLPAAEVPAVAFVRRWIAPVGELLLLAYLLRQFGKARRATAAADPLDRCRAVLLQLTGNARAAALLAGELTLPVYLFRKAPAGFSTGRQSGAALVLGCFLGLFVVETVALHFLLHLWKPVLAWALTGAGLYSCLQLAAHIRALRVRPTVLEGDVLHLRNGLLGGEADIHLSAIMAVETGKKLQLPEGTLYLGLVPKLETPNLLLRLSEDVPVRRAFGRLRSTRSIALSLDDAPALAALLQAR